MFILVYYGFMHSFLLFFSLFLLLLLFLCCCCFCCRLHPCDQRQCVGTRQVTIVSTFDVEIIVWIIASVTWDFIYDSVRWACWLKRYFFAFFQHINLLEVSMCHNIARLAESLIIASCWRNRISTILLVYFPPVRRVWIGNTSRRFTSDHVRVIIMKVLILLVSFALSFKFWGR